MGNALWVLIVAIFEGFFSGLLWGLGFVVACALLKLVHLSIT